MCTPQFSVYSVHDVLRSLEAVLYLISVKHLRETCARILSKFLLSNFDTSSRKFLFRLSRFAFYLVHGTCTRKKNSNRKHVTDVQVSVPSKLFSTGFFYKFLCTCVRGKTLDIVYYSLALMKTETSYFRFHFHACLWSLYGDNDM